MDIAPEDRRVVEEAFDEIEAALKKLRIALIGPRQKPVRVPSAQSRAERVMAELEVFTARDLGTMLEVGVKVAGTRIRTARERGKIVEHYRAGPQITWRWHG